MKLVNGDAVSQRVMFDALHGGNAVLMLNDPEGPWVLAPESASLDEVAACLPAEWALAADSSKRARNILSSSVAYPLVRQSQGATR